MGPVDSRVVMMLGPPLMIGGQVALAPASFDPLSYAAILVYIWFFAVIVALMSATRAVGVIAKRFGQGWREAPGPADLSWNRVYGDTVTLCLSAVLCDYALTRMHVERPASLHVAIGIAILGLLLVVACFGMIYAVTWGLLALQRSAAWRRDGRMT